MSKNLETPPALTSLNRLRCLRTLTMTKEEARRVDFDEAAEEAEDFDFLELDVAEAEEGGGGGLFSVSSPNIAER